MSMIRDVIISLYFHILADHRVEERRKDRQIPDPSQKTKNGVEHEGDSNTDYRWCSRNGL